MIKVYIPIKAQSQRVIKKNVRDFNGVPLYKHTLLKFKKYQNEFEVWVDTDSPEILTSIRTDPDLSHVKYYERPHRLRGHDVSVNKLIKNFIDVWCDKDDTKICQIHVTNPFLKIRTLQSAVNGFETIRGLKTVCSANVINSRMWQYRGWGTDNAKRVLTPINHNPMRMEQSQDLTPIYEENSLFYLFDVKTFLKHDNRVSADHHFMVSDHIEAVDIDTEEDWKFAIALAKGGIK